MLGPYIKLIQSISLFPSKTVLNQISKHPPKRCKKHLTIEGIFDTFFHCLEYDQALFLTPDLENLPQTYLCPSFS